MNAAMIYLILVTARLTPDIWDPYDVLGVSRVCTNVLRKSHNID
jgi:translocation protein SEC63